jgi:hypothetical protein
LPSFLVQGKRMCIVLSVAVELGQIGDSRQPFLPL